MRSITVFKAPFSSFIRLCPETRDWHSELSKTSTGNSFYTSITPTSSKGPESQLQALGT